MVRGKTPNPFAQSKIPLFLDILARRYKILPTAILQLNYEDFQLLYLCYEAGMKADKRQDQIQKRKINRGKKI